MSDDTASKIIDALTAEVARLSRECGGEVDVAGLRISDRAEHLPLSMPGVVSPNGACRMLRAADGWLATNLAREEDWDLLPAWLGWEPPAMTLDFIAEAVAARSAGELLVQAILLGLPVARVDEARHSSRWPALRRFGRSRQRRLEDITVLDLSALWAGPMCGAILAAAGAKVTRIESLSRPDPTQITTPRFFAGLAAGKTTLALDLTTADGRSALATKLASADVIITSARPRGVASLGLTTDRFFQHKEGAIWVAVTGYGYFDRASQRVAFGDDAAAAGGLVGWTQAGEPRFLGDALADPITGLSAAAGVMRAVIGGGGLFVDAALAHCAAAAAASMTRQIA